MPKLAEETSGPTAEEAEARMLGNAPSERAPGGRSRALGWPVMLPRGRFSSPPQSLQRSPLLLVATSLAGASASPVTITVTARDYAFKLSAKTAPVGKVTFAVTNTGKQDHSFQIAGKKTPC